MTSRPTEHPEPERRPKAIGINHVALEVGSIDEALAFYGAIFDFGLRGRSQGHVFVDLGDQFLALMEGREQSPDSQRHFGLVVDDRSRVRELAKAAGATILDGRFLDFLDPWGNRVEVVEYADLQFTKLDAVLSKLGVSNVKSESARREFVEKFAR